MGYGQFCCVRHLIMYWVTLRALYREGEPDGWNSIVDNLYSKPVSTKADHEHQIQAWLNGKLYDIEITKGPPSWAAFQVLQGVQMDDGSTPFWYEHADNV